MVTSTELAVWHPKAGKDCLKRQPHTESAACLSSNVPAATGMGKSYMITRYELSGSLYCITSWDTGSIPVGRHSEAGLEGAGQ